MSAAPAPAAAPGLGAAEVAAAAQLACLLEASAPKPGNVSPGHPFADAQYEDFLASAAAIGGPLAGAGGRPLGLTIRLAVESTTRWTRSNTNLGIVLLLAPIARAVLTGAGGPLAPRRAMSPSSESVGDAASAAAAALRPALRRVLEDTTVDDARDVYAAIRLASPGGLGRAGDQDVAHEPTVALVDAMRLAAHRDGVAREYATAFETTVEVGAPALARARDAGLSWADAIVETYLTLVAAAPDTHIARRAGPEAARDVSRRARETLERGGVRTDAGRAAIDAMDRALRDPRNTANPGTSADLTAAAIYLVLLAGGWPPRQGGSDAASR